MSKYFEENQEKIAKILTLLFFFLFILSTAYFEIKESNTITLSYFFYGILVLLVSIPLHVLLHEIGHLIAGLISGYDFLFFRFFNQLWINTEEGLSKRKESIPGILGQALMLPPNEKKNTNFLFYHLGGILINSLTILLFILAGQNTTDTFTSSFFYFSAGMAFYLVLTNLLPFQGTDGYNILRYFKEGKEDEEVKKLLFLSKEMIAGDSFVKIAQKIDLKEDANFKNPNTTTFYSIQAASHLEKEEFNEANELYGILYSHKEDLFPGHQLTISMSYLFTLLLVERDNPELLKMIDSKDFSNYKKRKQADSYRLLAAKALYLDDDSKLAEQYLSEGIREIPFSPSVSEEKLERKLFHYLEEEILKKK